MFLSGYPIPRKNSDTGIKNPRYIPKKSRILEEISRLKKPEIFRSISIPGISGFSGFFLRFQNPDPDPRDLGFSGFFFRDFLFLARSKNPENAGSRNNLIPEATLIEYPSIPEMPETEVGYIINSMFVLRLIITWYVYPLPKFIKIPKI